jgi:maltose O-acetyltransferase
VPSLLTTFRRGVARYRDLPARDIVGKTWVSLVAMGGAQLHLRGVDRVGRRSRAVGRPLIENRGHMSLGDGVTLNSEYAPVHLVSEPGGRLTVGNDVFANFGTMISARTVVELADRVYIGPYSLVVDTDIPLPSLAPDRAARLVRSAPVYIGEDVWLGGRVVVLGGSRIGARSVIAAGSVVAGEIPPYVIAGGNPARVIKPLPGFETT